MENKEWDFETVYAYFQPRVYCYLARLIGPREAEDVAQEVFIKAQKGMAAFRSESQLSTWIYRIATNAAIDKMRSSSFSRESDSKQERRLVKTAQEYSLDEKVIQKETTECIHGIIEKLPENYRLIVILSELEGFKNQEIADILGVTISVVKARLHRGRAKLKQELMKNCDFSWDERNEFTCDPKNCG